MGRCHLGCGNCPVLPGEVGVLFKPLLPGSRGTAPEDGGAELRSLCPQHRLPQPEATGRAALT